MLVLSRRIEESIVFPQLDIEIYVVHLSPSQVRIGVTAPRDIKVLRGELVDKHASEPNSIEAGVPSQPAGSLPAPDINSSDMPKKRNKPIRCKESRVPLIENEEICWNQPKDSIEDSDSSSIANHSEGQGERWTHRPRQHPLPKCIRQSGTPSHSPHSKSDADQLEQQVNEAKSKLAIALSILNSSQDFETVDRIGRIKKKLAQLNTQLETLRIAAETSYPSSKSILLVDPNENESRLLAGYLELKGFAVVVANDKQQALNWLEGSEIPEYMILDIRMPKLDAQLTIDGLRKNARYDGMRIIGLGDPAELGVEAGRAGVDQWFPKPLNPENFVQALETPSVTSPETNPSDIISSAI